MPLLHIQLHERFKGSCILYYYAYIPAGLAVVSGLAQAKSTCPDVSGPATVNGTSVCYNGIAVSANTFESGLTGCTQTFADCFPFCIDSFNDASTVGGCTSAPLTASNYTSCVYGSNAVTTTTSSTHQTASTGVTKASALATNGSNTITSASSGTQNVTTATGPCSFWHYYNPPIWYYRCYDFILYSECGRVPHNPR
ncbi:hypothetical protein AB5N19_06886 [Seiridium cardinale]